MKIQLVQVGTAPEAFDALKAHESGPAPYFFTSETEHGVYQYLTVYALRPGGTACGYPVGRLDAEEGRFVPGCDAAAHPVVQALLDQAPGLTDLVSKTAYQVLDPPFIAEIFRRAFENVIDQAADALSADAA